MTASRPDEARPHEDRVVLLDEEGRPTGTAPRSTVHDEQTPLHLAFSCHVFDAEGEVLVTRRALVKRTWPGVWTNSFCGHPRPEEEVLDAVHRHARHELGLEVCDVRPLLPDFRYRAVDASGTVENEMCPVFTARTGGPARPNPEEVMDLRWIAPEQLAAAVTAAPWTLSPWLVQQLEEITPETLVEVGRRR